MNGEDLNGTTMYVCVCVCVCVHAYIKRLVLCLSEVCVYGKCFNIYV